MGYEAQANQRRSHKLTEKDNFGIWVKRGKHTETQFYQQLRKGFESKNERNVARLIAP